jgi:hypothetical protein
LATPDISQVAIKFGATPLEHLREKLFLLRGKRHPAKYDAFSLPILQIDESMCYPIERDRII